MKQWEPELTEEERVRFEEEEILSPYQHVIAYSCAGHQNKRRVLVYSLYLSIRFSIHRRQCPQVVRRFLCLFINSVEREFIQEHRLNVNR